MAKKRKPALIKRKKGTVTITPEGRSVIKAMATEGQDERTISGALGISQRTLKRCKERDELVEDAWADGHAALADEITHLLLQCGRKGNVVALIFLAKCRLGWIDQPQPEERAPAVVIHLPDARSPEEYLKLIEHQPLELPAPEEKSDVFGPIPAKVVR